MFLNPNIRIGCSGWQYRHWRGLFYPAELPQGRWLDYYAQHFDTVEINNTFYRLPEVAAFAAWRRHAPPGFVYAVKASRAFGPVLYQLPPRWPVNLERLETFLKALPRTRRHTIEFRDASCYSDAVFALLERHKVALCLHDMAGSATGKLTVGPFVYVRFHGTQKYTGRYSDATLESWAEWLADRARDGFPVYAYFNNDTRGHAPRDAARLKTALAAL
jgi:uncharacterized protein YecE (DUF72 family)